MPNSDIIVVDDDYASRILITKVLEKAHYRIHECDSAYKDLELIRIKPVDLIITDLKMDGMNGLELLERVKKQSPQIAIMILTGFASIQTAIDSLRLGAIDYLRKPINIDELIIRVKKAIERKELEKKLAEAERRLTYNATITTANHEINQPLTVILSGIDMLKMEFQRQGVEDKKLQHYLNIIEKSSIRIADILKRLREISSPKILNIPHGMQMIKFQLDEKEGKGDVRYILLIEDEEQIRQIIKDMLEYEGYKVILASNAEEGIEIFQAQKNFIDLIILDFYLPDLNGYQVFSKIREIHENPKVIITSGFEYDNDIQKVLEQGAIGFLSKPFNRKQLVTVVQKYTYGSDEK
jgi:DNA-binding response OmpR family regulator